jgi:hypothetical protein
MGPQIQARFVNWMCLNAPHICKRQNLIRGAERNGASSYFAECFEITCNNGLGEIERVFHLYQVGQSMIGRDPGATSLIGLPRPPCPD